MHLHTPTPTQGLYAIESLLGDPIYYYFMIAVMSAAEFKQGLGAILSLPCQSLASEN